MTSSSLLVNAYTNEILLETKWDFEDETPGNDAREIVQESSMAPMVETHLANTVLTNGARFYVDHAHPEYSTPECLDALECLVHDKAGEYVMRDAMKASAKLVPPALAPIIYKNNSDGKGNSYGCHENYMMDRKTPFNKIVQGIIPHFVTRQIFAGAGKVGTETSAFGQDFIPFQISQRAEFFEEVVGLETTVNRPIVNTRDEPHADPKRFRRLHVIVGDANLSETATFLKVGTTAFVLSLIEDGILPNSRLSLVNPVHALHQISSDPTLQATFRLEDATSTTALDIQWELFTASAKHFNSYGLESVGAPEIGSMILDRWEHVLTALETDPELLSNQLDWVAKRRIVQGYRDRHGCTWTDHRLLALDLQYHDLRPERSLFTRLKMDRLVDDQRVQSAVSEPPSDTRAWFRGKCLARWPKEVVAANWDSLVFDVGIDPLRRVPMMDPLRGTAQHTAKLLEDSADLLDLLKRLDA